MPRTAPRRRATRHGRVKDRTVEPAPVRTAAPDPVPAKQARAEIAPIVAPVPRPVGSDDHPVQHALLVALWLLVVAGGLAALVAALIPTGPP